MSTLPEVDKPKSGKRRVRGEGSIYFDGRLYRASVRLPGGKRKYLAAKTRPAVAKKLREAVGHAEKGLPFTPEKLTVAAHMAQWLHDVEPTVKPKTFYSYEQMTRLHVLPALGKIRLAKLSPADITRLLADLAKPPGGRRASSPRTRQYVLAILKMALKSARDSELIARNVAELVKATRVTQAEVRPLDHQSVIALIDASKGHRFEHLIAFLLGSGLRLGEALALRWQDVDRQHASINVSHTLERIPGKPWRIAEPKSASGRRVVPLIGPAADSLHAQRKRVAELRLAARAWTDNDLVFPNAKRTPTGVLVSGGDPLEATNVYHELQKLLAKAGLPPARVHDLRHGTATYLLAAGVDPRVVMQIMGWSQVSMLKRYQHVLDSMLTDAAERLDAFWKANISV